MTFEEIIPGFYELTLGAVNLFLLEGSEGPVLIDTAYPGSEKAIIAALHEIGHKPEEIRHVLLTHGHPDHVGGLAGLKRRSDAQAHVHPADLWWLKQKGRLDPRKGERVLHPGPGLLTWMLYQQFIKPVDGLEPVNAHEPLSDGQVLPFARGLRVLHAPGHSQGQVVFLLEEAGGVLIAGDTCANVPALNWSLGYEDLATAKRSLKKLCTLDFEQAVFGHGQAIKSGAAEKWRARWGKL